MAIIEPGGGRVFKRMNDMTVKVKSSDTNGTYEMCEEKCPPGFAVKRKAIMGMGKGQPKVLGYSNTCVTKQISISAISAIFSVFQNWWKDWRQPPLLLKKKCRCRSRSVTHQH